MSDRGDAASIRPFTDSLPMALLQARESAMRLFRPMLAEHDLTEQQWRVLRALSASASPMEVGEIADATFLLRPSLTRILANLAERDIVDRRPVEDDARRAAISLTRTGRALVARVAPHSERIYADIEAAFGRRELGELIDRLTDLRKNLGDLP
ncbi:MAG: homoprotocatechuate degradation operon regulator HpaR [Actinomycetota bacterium]